MQHGVQRLPSCEEEGKVGTKEHERGDRLAIDNRICEATILIDGGAHSL